MTPQYRHWIQPASEGVWPGNVLCVDCVANLTMSSPEQTGRREILSSWAAVLLTRGQTGYLQLGEFVGEMPATLLDVIGKLSDNRENLWVVSFQCGRVWSLLRLWEEIEHGRVRLYDTDHRNSEARRERAREYRKAQKDPLRTLGGSEIARLASRDTGYIVCEDPPNILRARVLNHDQSFCWVDVRNYGIDNVGDAMPGVATSRWIATFMSRILYIAQENGLTALKATSGSQAMSAWRHSFLTESVYVHTDRRATDIESAAYSGGRCEATRIGVIPEPCYHVDFRSQYGWVCAECRLPTRLADFSASAGPAGHSPIGDYSCKIADVTIETDEPCYPVKRDGLVIYPVGRFRTALCGPELAIASQRRNLVAVHAEATYEMGYPLSDYARRMYELRCQEERDGVPGSSTWVKRLIVGLPGKLGQRNHRWIDCPGVMPQQMYGEWYGEDGQGGTIRYRAIAGIVQRDCVSGYAADSVPSIAAFVTSYGRVRLLSAIRIAGWANVYYYDTDSLVTNEEGLSRLSSSELMQSDGMGYLTLRARPDHCEIRGVKYYVQDGRVTCSGLSRGNVTDAGDGLHYRRTLTPAEQSRRGERPEARIVEGTYLRAEAYNQGTVGPDGVVSPIVLDE